MRKIREIWNVMSTYFLIILILSFVFVFLPIGKAFDKNGYITLQFLLIGIISSIGIIANCIEYNYSIGLIVWFFTYAFLFCGGLTQYANDAFRWGLSATEYEVEYANNLVLVWMIFYTVGKNTRFRLIIKQNQSEKSFLNKKITIENRRMLLILLILLAYGLYTIYLNGWRSLLMRTTFTSIVSTKVKAQSVRTLITTIIRGLAFWSTMICIKNYKNNRSWNNIGYLILAFMVLFINVPPLGVARYLVASVYGGILLYAFNWVKKKNIIMYVLSVGLLLAFPLLNAFRGIYTETISMDFIIKSMGSISDNFATADYDAYSMLIYTIRYVNRFSITYGKQLIGVLLFFIPSSIWKNKPGGSGALMIDNLASEYNPNVSCPILAEGYINFGIVGVILFSFVLGCIVRRLDCTYWKKWNTAHDTIGAMGYCFLLFFILFLCRGDLLSSLSYLIGYFCALVIIVFLLGS